MYFEFIMNLVIEDIKEIHVGSKQFIILRPTQYTDYKTKSGIVNM